MVEEGSELTVVVAEALPEHPFASVTVTVKVAALFSEIHCVVAPVFHIYEENPAVAHICVELPEQNERAPVMDGDGFWFTESDLLELLVQPLASLTVTVYVPAELTVTHCVVAPVLHK